MYYTEAHLGRGWSMLSYNLDFSLPSRGRAQKVEPFVDVVTCKLHLGIMLGEFLRMRQTK